MYDDDDKTDDDDDNATEPIAPDDADNPYTDMGKVSRTGAHAGQSRPRHPRARGGSARVANIMASVPTNNKSMNKQMRVWSNLVSTTGDVLHLQSPNGFRHGVCVSTSPACPHVDAGHTSSGKNRRNMHALDILPDMLTSSVSASDIRNDRK